MAIVNYFVLMKASQFHKALGNQISYYSIELSTNSHDAMKQLIKTRDNITCMKLSWTFQGQIFPNFDHLSNVKCIEY